MSYHNMMEMSSPFKVRVAKLRPMQLWPLRWWGSLSCPRLRCHGVLVWQSRLKGHLKDISFSRLVRQANKRQINGKQINDKQINDKQNNDKQINDK